jgi:hypothetical protein
VTPETGKKSRFSDIRKISENNVRKWVDKTEILFMVVLYKSPEVPMTTAAVPPSRQRAAPIRKATPARTEFVAVRLTAAEKEQVAARAMQEGVSFSSVVRGILATALSR